jgi:hypothetical protein
VATYRPFAALCGEMMKSPDDVKASLCVTHQVSTRQKAWDGKGDGRKRNVPADAMLFHLPPRAILAVEDIVGVVDVLLQPSRDFPLGVVGLVRRCRHVSAWEDF